MTTFTYLPSNATITKDVSDNKLSTLGQLLKDNINKNRAAETAPNLVGGLGQGGRMDDFHVEWKMSKAASNTWVVGRRDKVTKGCFSIRKYAAGQDISIAFYANMTPTDVFRVLRGWVDYPESMLSDATFHDADERNKYLAIDLLKILAKEKEYLIATGWKDILSEVMDKDLGTKVVTVVSDTVMSVDAERYYVTIVKK